MEQYEDEIDRIRLIHGKETKHMTVEQRVVHSNKIGELHFHARMADGSKFTKYVWASEVMAIVSRSKTSAWKTEVIVATASGC